MSVIWFVRYAPKEIGRQRPESSISRISFDIAYCTTHWEEIYPVHRVNPVIHPAFKIERGLEPRRECSCVFALLTLHVFLLQMETTKSSISNLLFLFCNFYPFVFEFPDYLSYTHKSNTTPSYKASFPTATAVKSRPSRGGKSMKQRHPW